MADAALAPTFFFLTGMSRQLGAKDPLEGRPKLSAWWDHVQDHTSTKRALGEQHAALSAMMKKWLQEARSESNSAANWCGNGGAAMAPLVQIIGSFLSPYVRKVLVALDLKGISFEFDPIVPFFGDDRFSQLSPIRRIPVLIDDCVTLPDSSVICQYLEDRYPQPPLYPLNIADRARARWLEEYADSHMGEVFIWKLFNQVVIKPAVWGELTDQANLQRTLNKDMPQVLGYLETQVPAEGFIFGDVSIADISIACFFRNANFARFRVDAAQWPRTSSFVERVLKLESFQKLKPIEERLLRTPLAQVRTVLTEISVPLTRETCDTSKPRRGMMRIN